MVNILILSQLMIFTFWKSIKIFWFLQFILQHIAIEIGVKNAGNVTGFSGYYFKTKSPMSESSPDSSVASS